jgi:hypothetical protein
MELLTPPAIYPIFNNDHDSRFELLFRGGRVPNQNGDGLLATRKFSGLPCMRADGTELGCLRSIQYSRTANFRAIATFATALPRRNFTLK